MILGYLFSCSLTFSTQSASNIRGKIDKDIGDHDTGIPVLLFFNFQHAISQQHQGARLTRIKVIMILGYLFSSLSASNIGGKTDKDKGDHDTGILVLFS
jgi:hypothetical protein